MQSQWLPRVVAVGILLTVPLALLHADDVVVLETAEGEQRSVRGEVTDWTGERLLLRQENGSEASIPGDRIVEVVSPLSASHLEGIRHRDAAEYEQALEQYRRALGEESRRWRQRQVLAEITSCQMALEQWVAAGESFLLLTESDPSTPFFDRIPLAWTPVVGNIAIDAQARRWMTSDNPIARLLGANLLLAGAGRADAQTVLRRLTSEADARVAALALAQLWRSEVATAREQDIVGWEKRIDQMPVELRAGPYFVVGRAWAQKRKHEQAALSLLRVPLVYPHMRSLAAGATRLAAIELVKANQPEEAATLFREFLREFDDSPYADDVRQRLTQLDESERNP